jgi:beta-glucuronidase
MSGTRIDLGGAWRFRIDSRPGFATIPGWAMKLKDSGSVWYDWWHYGGIVRDVALVAHESAALRRQQIRTSLAAGVATVKTRAFVETFARGALRIEGRVVDESGTAGAWTGADLREATPSESPRGVSLPPVTVPSPRQRSRRAGR